MARLTIMWLIVVGAWCVKAQSAGRDENRHLTPGEDLHYTMNYGWFTIGKAEIFFDKEMWEVNDRPHYYLQCRVQTTGVFDFFTSTDICLESWIDVASLRPELSYRQVFFGSKMDIRTDRYDYADSITISTYVEDVDRHQTIKVDLSDTLVLDLLSTYLNLREIIYEHERSDTTLVKTHFSNDIYPFGIIHSGTKEEDLLKFDFIFPESDQYKKGNAAYILASKDHGIVPEKVVMELALGKLVFTLVDQRHY